MALTSQTRLKWLIEVVAAKSRHVLVQKNPYFPDVLNQPEVLVVREVGHLLAVYLYATPQRLTWRNTLPAIEDLFELKLAAGELTTAVTVMQLSEEVQNCDANLLGIMANMFDLFIPIPSDVNADIEQIASHLHRALADIAPKRDYFQLWKMERARVARELERFSEERYHELVDERRQRSRTPNEVTASILRAVQDSPFSKFVHQRFAVQTPKEALAGLPVRNRFVFDLALTTDHPNQSIRAIDVVSVARYGSRPTLRYLMTKARFTSYEPIGQHGGLVYREKPLRPVLLVDGNLAGPSHDPYRYVRSLISVGWG